ncbi:MAG: Cysteine proteinase [Verrucomicrobiales bacterium]|nr:Cysteine proteinase [Verrucomicrobiales bacterium]
MRMSRTFSLSLAFFSAALLVSAKDAKVHSFKKLQLTDQFWSEGANIGDFNHDGKMDVVSGPYWYEAPDFKKKHEYYPATESFKKKNADGTETTIPGFEGGLGTNNTYSKNFIAFSSDFNHDGWADILILGFPGEQSWWFENPRHKEGHWLRHVALDVTDNESPTFLDVTGDRKPEIICSSGGYMGYAEPDAKNPTNKFKFHRISENKNYHRFTHGLGVGDVNNDGRNDILERDGWYEQPLSLGNDPVWKFHPAPFAPAPSMGSSQMYVYDVNADGYPDVITALAAHGYGLAWFEQKKEKNPAGEVQFEKHIILNPDATANKDGITFSQLHAVDLVDIDGDGLKDIVTGKRFWAHGNHGDADPNGPAVLYWFQLVRNKDKSVDFVPHLIDDNSGIGTQVVAADINGDKLPDIIVGNKKGTFVHIHEVTKEKQ